MKVVIVLLATLVVAYAAPQKRFFITDVQNFFHNLQDKIIKAKDQFKDLVGHLNIHFDRVVAVLVDQIDSGMTEGACKLICEKGATHLFGADNVGMSGELCGPACTASLAKLEEAAG